MGINNIFRSIIFLIVLLKIFIFISHVYVFCLHVSPSRACSACVGQKWTVDPLELELQWLELLCVC